MVEELQGHFKPSSHAYHQALSMLYGKGLKCKKIKAMVLTLVDKCTRLLYAYPTLMLVLGLSLLCRLTHLSAVTSILPTGGRVCIRILNIWVDSCS